MTPALWLNLLARIFVVDPKEHFDLFVKYLTVRSLYLHLKVYLFIYVKCQTWPHMVFDIWVYIDNSFLTIDNFIFSSMLITDILIDPEHALNQLNDHKVQTDTYCNCYKYQICKLTSYFVFVKSIGHHILLYL
jgi:hypothetical protein